MSKRMPENQTRQNLRMCARQNVRIYFRWRISNGIPEYIYIWQEIAKQMVKHNGIINVTKKCHWVGISRRRWHLAPIFRWQFFQGGYHTPFMWEKIPTLHPKMTSMLLNTTCSLWKYVPVLHQKIHGIGGQFGLWGLPLPSLLQNGFLRQSTQLEKTKKMHKWFCLKK